MALFGAVNAQQNSVKFNPLAVFGGSDMFTYDDSKDNYSSFGVSAKMGYQWVWDSGFTLDLNGGLVYRTYNYDSSSIDSSVLKANGIGPAFGFGLGYTW